jgi:hypothetical protein
MKLASLVLISALAAAALAQAQTSAPAPAPVPDAPSARKACRADAMKLCSGMRGQVALACLRSNSDKISPDCTDAIQVATTAELLNSGGRRLAAQRLRAASGKRPIRLDLCR